MSNEVQKWEYHRLYLDHGVNVMDKLCDVGERGWELVSTIIDPNTTPPTQLSLNIGHYWVWYLFKRPKQNP